MNEIGKRLDGLAKGATRSVRVLDPSVTAHTANGASSHKRGLVIGFAAVIVIAAMLAVWQGGDDSPTSVIAAQGEEQPLPCAVDPVLGLLRAGIPTFDYEPAGSYLQLADRTSDIVTGGIMSARRTVVNDRSFIELTITDVVDVRTQAPRPDVDVIAYEAVWSDRSSPDPLARAVAFNDVRFVGFLAPWSGVRGGWAPGVEGLYVACGDDTPSSAVIADAAGPTDSRAPTLSQLINLVRAPLVNDMEEAQRAAEEAARLAEEEAQLVEDILLTQARELWQAADIKDYRLRYSLLGPEGFASVVRLSVNSGEISTLESFAGDSEPAEDESLIAYTVPDLFDLIAAADSVREARFDSERGFPTLISLDPDDSLPGDELRIDNVELFSQTDLDDIEAAITSWLPLPTGLPDEVRERLGIDLDTIAGKAFVLHDEAEMEVWLYRTDADVCVTVAQKTGLESGSPVYGGTASTCPEDAQFATTPTLFSTTGGRDNPPYAVIVPPVSYLDETWTVQVTTERAHRVVTTERSVLVIFEANGSGGGARVEVLCECGDIGMNVVFG